MVGREGELGSGGGGTEQTNTYPRKVPVRDQWGGLEAGSLAASSSGLRAREPSRLRISLGELVAVALSRGRSISSLSKHGRQII